MMKMIQDENTEWSRIYDSNRDFIPIATEELDIILSYTDTLLAKNNLDLACGTGQLTRELNNRGYSCTGLDIADSAISRAKNAALGTDLRYFHFDLEQDFSTFKPISSTQFSLITIKLAYAFIENKKDFLKRIVALIAPGGIFVIITPEIKTTPLEKQEIAVDIKETSKLLSNFFDTVSSFELNDMTYFICKKPRK